MIKVGITGHRKIGESYDENSPAHIFVKDAIKKTLTKLLEADSSIWGCSGLALGADSIFCDVCDELGIPYVGAVPFKGQELKWNIQAQERYSEYIKKAKKIIVVSDGNYSPKKMFLRNEYIVDNIDVLIVIWDGRNSGGTYQCLQYAKSKNKIIIHIDPNDYKNSK